MSSLRKISLTLAAAIALSATLVPANAETVEPAAAAKVGVRLATYNVCGHGCLETDSKCRAFIGRNCGTNLRAWKRNGNPYRAKAVAKNIAGASPDVVTTQEIGNNPTKYQKKVTVDYFRKPLGKSLSSRGYSQAPITCSSNSAGYKWPVVKADYSKKRAGTGRVSWYRSSTTSIKASSGKYLPCGIYRYPVNDATSATWNTFRNKSTGALYVVANIHMTSGSGSIVKQNSKNMKAFTSYLESRSDIRGLPTFIQGDWNSASTANNTPLRAAMDAGFRNTYAATSNRGTSKYASFISSTKSLPIRTGSKIDVIMFKKGTAEVSWWRLRRETSARSGSKASRIDSDHNMIRARVVIPVVTG